MTRQARGMLVLAVATVAVVAAFVGITGPRPGDRWLDRPASEAPAGLTQSVSTIDPVFQARAEPRRLAPPRQPRTSPPGLAVFSAVVAATAGLVWRRTRYETLPLPVPLRLIADAPHRGPPLPLV